jgi:regulator of protease activity HflC (stomatin/prohibitin superfamily)
VIDRPIMVDIAEKFVDLNEAANTRDSARISVDARISWHIVDPLRSVVNVQSFANALQDIATTALREVIGDVLLVDVLSTRERIAEDLRAKLEEQTKAWGGKITNVEIRDIISRTEGTAAIDKGGGN